MSNRQDSEVDFWLMHSWVDGLHSLYSEIKPLGSVGSKQKFGFVVVYGLFVF